MKNTLLVLVIMLSCLTAFAQHGPGHGHDPQAREKIRAAHAAYVTERMELTSSESEKFWPLYREYNDKRRNIRLEMRGLRQTKGDDQSVLDAELSLKQKELDLEKEYTEKMKKVVSTEKLLKLRQAEADFRKLLLRKVQERRSGPR
jgi:hypothetical protein